VQPKDGIEVATELIAVVAMADSINRIVPPSASVDRGTELRRERGKNNGDRRRKPHPSAEPGPASPDDGAEAPPPETDKDKGSRLDISA